MTTETKTKTKRKAQILYKLTTQDNKTRVGQDNETTWTPGTTIVATGIRGQGLCSNEYLHAYENPLIAVVMNSQHAAIDNPKMFQVVGIVDARDGQLKCGSHKLRVGVEVPLPKISTNALVHFAILCGKAFYKNPVWNKWADNWLLGKDRTANAAYAAAAAANAAYAAANAAAYAAAAAHAANAAAYAAADDKILDLYSLLNLAIEAEK